MTKIRVKLEADKLRPLVKTEEYTNSEGETVKKQVIEFDLVEMNEKKFRSESDKVKVFKTHFACLPSKKKENGEYEETVFIGDGVQFEWKNATTGQNKPSKAISENVVDYPEDDISPSDIPF